MRRVKKKFLRQEKNSVNEKVKREREIWEKEKNGRENDVQIK